jgi:hypothetical protein
MNALSSFYLACHKGRLTKLLHDTTFALFCSERREVFVMQIIYAAPFILLSILAFFVFLAVPQFRRFASAAFVVPITFGVCSIVGWIAFILIAGNVLHLNLGPAIGIHGIVEGLLFYVLPGVVGAWIAVRLIHIVERSFLNTQTAKNFVIRVILATILAFVGAFVGLGLATHLLPAGSTVASLWIAFLSSILSATAGFVIAMGFQRRVASASKAGSGS